MQNRSGHRRAEQARPHQVLLSARGGVHAAAVAGGLHIVAGRIVTAAELDAGSTATRDLS